MRMWPELAQSRQQLDQWEYSEFFWPAVALIILTLFETIAFGLGFLLSFGSSKVYEMQLGAKAAIPVITTEGHRWEWHASSRVAEDQSWPARSHPSECSECGWQVLCQINGRSDLTFDFSRTDVKHLDPLHCNLLVAFLSLLYGDGKDGVRPGWLGVHRRGGHGPTVVALLQTGNGIQGNENGLLSESHNLIPREKKIPLRFTPRILRQKYKNWCFFFKRCLMFPWNRTKC